MMPFPTSRATKARKPRMSTMAQALCVKRLRVVSIIMPSTLFQRIERRSWGCMLELVGIVGPVGKARMERGEGERRITGRKA